MAIRTVVSKLVLVVALCPLLKSKSSFFDIEELQNLKYGVEITSEPVLLLQNGGDNTMHVTSKHGQKYQCVLPVLHMKGDKNSSRNITNDEIGVLLEPLNSTCLLLLDGWWTYKVCLGKSVYQFHEEGIQVKDNISLGHHIRDTDWSSFTDEKKSSSKERYHSQFYSNGSVCDLTGESRTTEVRILCDPQSVDYIARIDESSTCVYVITVYTNKLCNHVLFRPAKIPETHGITCAPALIEEQFQKYSESKTKAVQVHSIEDSTSDKNEKVEDKPKKRTLGIFEAIAKLFDKGAKEKDAESDDVTREENRGIDWEDVFKTSRSAIDKSVESIRKLNLHEKLGVHADDVEESRDEESRDEESRDEESLDEESRDEESRDEESRDEESLDEESRDEESRDEENHDEESRDEESRDEESRDEENHDEESRDEESLDTETTSEVPMKSMKGEEPVSNGYLYEKEKEKMEKKSEYYQRLIEKLKIDYDYFKKQIEILTKDMHKKIERLESRPGKVDPFVSKVVERIKQTVRRFEENQGTIDNEMKRLTDINAAFARDPNYSTAKDEIAGIRKRLNRLMVKLMSKRSSLNDNDEMEEEEDESDASIKDDSVNTFKDESDTKGSRKQDQLFDVENPRLNKVVSKLTENIMTYEANEDLEGDEREIDDEMLDDDDDRISVRVTKIKNNEQDLFDESDESLYADDGDKELEEINENEEMKTAKKKMESIVRKQLQEAGIKHEGKIKVKIITSKEALKRVAGGRTGFQILTPQESHEFKDVLSNLLGGNQQLMKEKERHDKLEQNYNLVWNEDSFTSAKKDFTTDQENSDQRDN